MSVIAFSRDRETSSWRLLEAILVGFVIANEVKQSSRLHIWIAAPLRGSQ